VMTGEDRRGTGGGGESGSPAGSEGGSRSSAHEQRMEVFQAIAHRVVTEIKPRRVLDAACGSGCLVEALRDRGVEAYGIDTSEDAIEAVLPTMRPYCRVASAVEPLEDSYDLIFCIDRLDHLADEEARRAIANICRSTGDVLFSPTPGDSMVPSRVTGRPAAWWITLFEEQSFQLDVDFDAGFISGEAMRFRAGPVQGSLLGAVLSQRQDLLRQLAALRVDIQARDAAAAGLRAALADLEVRCALMESERAALRQQGEEKDKLIAGLNYHLLAVQRTIGWKMLGRLRRVRDRLLPPESPRRILYWQIRRLVEVLLDEGLSAFVRKTRHKIRLKRRGQKVLIKAPPHDAMLDLERQYELWVERHRLTSRDGARMKAEQEAFAYTPVISIVTPVYNTDEVLLRKAIESVRGQVYPHWELCLVDDGSTASHVRRVLDEYVGIEPRVWAKHLPHSQGIAGASSRGLGLATGEFVAFLGHDDELSPDALFELARRLNEEPDLDLIYTDEDKLDPEGRRVEPFFKPDWSPDLLLSMNYIAHLSVFRRSLLGEIGGFRLGLDGAEDYDLLLRFTERTQRIGHIPKILYHRRKVPGSIAASSAAKMSAFEAGREAIEDAVRRRGYDARVENILPGLYAVRYQVTGTPLVSIIVPTRDRWPLLQACLRSIEEKTRDVRYEIIVVDNGSTEPETLRGLNAIAAKWRVCAYPGPFNFSAINNFAVTQARGEYLVFLNNDTQVVEPDWLTALLEHVQRPEVGAAGARLDYPDGRIQHAGLVLGVGGVADHAFKGLPGDACTYFALANVVRNVSGVTAACMMVSRRAFETVGGFDEQFRVAFNDVDFCLRLRARGYLIVYTPFALVYHHESGTRGRLQPPEEEELVWTIWGDQIRRGDPYYNPNLTTSRSDWSLGG
jgi:GT2 family glycosyltransferase/SAM-dependent methyltransferase